MARKRAPGGGRKPQGEFSGKAAVFSTRITPELRAALERESVRSGRSLSQEVERRLRCSLEIPSEIQKEWGPPHIRILAKLLSEVTRWVEGVLGAPPFDEKASDFAWHKNGDTHAAVTTAINTILAHYKPTQPGPTPEPLKRPSEWLVQLLGQERADQQCTTEGVGLSCALGMLHQVAVLERPAIDHPANVHHSPNYYWCSEVREILK